MNPEAHKIIEKMEKLIPEIDSINTNNHPAINNVLSIHSSRLLVILAEEQEKSAEKLEQQTLILIRFTKLLVGLTWALIFIGVIQITMMFCKH
jgi:hypothetical protein